MSSIHPQRGDRGQVAWRLRVAMAPWAVALCLSAATPAGAQLPDLRLVPSAPCVQDTVTVFVRGFAPTPCDSFIGAEKTGSASLRILTQVYDARQCLVAPSGFYSVPVVMGRFPAGANRIEIRNLLVHVHSDGTVDTTASSSALDFDVAVACQEPSPIPAELLPYVVRVGTVPDPPCPSRPTTLHIGGVFRDGCGKVISVDPSTLSLVISPCPPVVMPCTMGLQPWSADFPLGFLATGTHQATVRMTVLGNDAVWPPFPTQTYLGTFAFTVGPECGPGPSSLPYVGFIQVRPQRDCALADTSLCPGDSLVVTIGGVFPGGTCLHVAGIELIPPLDLTPFPMPARVRLTVADQGCTRIACTETPVPWSQSVTIGPLLARDYQLIVEEVRVLGCPPTAQDTTVGLAPFTVVPADQCPLCHCLVASWEGSGSCTPIDPGSSAAITLAVGSPTALAGLEGSLNTGGPALRIVQLEAVGAAAGMRLSWTPIAPDGVRFVLLADQGAPIPPTPAIAPAMVPVLKVTVSLAAADDRHGTRYSLSTGWDLLGSDAQGGAVPMCPPAPNEFRLPPTANFCVTSGECDFNGDAAIDIRDLVLMVHCVYDAGSCPPDAATRFDCDGNGSFDLSDVLCCAIEALRRPGCPDCPVDSVREEPLVGLEFGAPAVTAGGIDVPLRVRGEGLLGATRIRLRFPSDRFYVAGVVASGLISLHEVQGDEVVLGLVGPFPVYLLPGGPIPPNALLHLALRPGQTPGGQVSVTAAEFSGLDGVKLDVPLDDPSVDLTPSAGLALSAARPNPFAGETRFSVTLEQAGTLDVGVYDLAGRRVAILFHGPLMPGRYPFSWNGRTGDGAAVGGGVYFYRAVANGQSATRRMVMLQGH